MLGLKQTAAEPLGHGQAPIVEDGIQHPLALADHGQGLRSERGRSLGIAAQVGEGGTFERDRRGNVHQQARALADGRLQRLISSTVRTCPPRRRAVARLRPGRRWQPPRTSAPGTAVDGMRPARSAAPTPPGSGGPFATQDEAVDVLLDQPHGRGAIPGGQRMPHSVVGLQAVLLTPGRRGPLQLQHPAGLFLPQPGGSRSANNWR